MSSQPFLPSCPASESEQAIAPEPPTTHRSLTASAQTNLNWGVQYCRQHRFARALTCLSMALQQYTRLQHPVGIGKCLNALSTVYLQTQNYHRAQAYSHAAIAILEATAARQDYALAVYQLGVSYFKGNQLAQAQQYLEQALALYHDLPDSFNEDRVLLHLGQLYAARQEWMFALACYEAVLDSVLLRGLQTNTQELLLTVLELMMQLCEQSYGDDCAIVPLQEILTRYIASSDRPQIAQLFRQLGHFYESQQRYTLALECYTQALRAMPPEALL